MPKPRSVHIADHRPEWPERALDMIRALREAAPGLFVEIEHIGSTAVPGLPAKPVIDLMAAVHDLALTRIRRRCPAPVSGCTTTG